MKAAAAALNAGPILLVLVFVSCWQLVFSSHVHHTVIKNSSTTAAAATSAEEEIISNAIDDDIGDSEDKWPPKCSGTWSLLGVREWNGTNLRCCESDGMCHGFNPQTVEKLVIGSLKGLLNVTSRHLSTENTFTFQSRFRSSTSTFEGSGGGGGGDAAIKEDEATKVEIVEEGSGSSAASVSSSSSSTSSFAPCCRSKVSAFLPVTGISAISGKRMAVIQIEQFQQYAISEHCPRGACRFLRGNCTQVYSPQPLYVLSTEGSGDTSKLAAKLDFILVESGCRCHQHRLGDQSQEEEQMDEVGVEASLSKMGVDATVPKELRFITGLDFQEDYLAALLALADNDNGIDNDNDSHTPLPIDRQTDDPWLSSHDFTASLETSRVTDPVTFITTTTASSSSWITTGTQPTTQLPLPVLPDKHGAPLHIPAGHFNPVLLSIQKFLLATPAAHRHRQSMDQSVH